MMNSTALPHHNEEIPYRVWRHTASAIEHNSIGGVQRRVFAIAITLLVLDIALHSPGTQLHQVLNAWPYYLAYAVSFLTICAAWLGHVALTDRLTRADLILLRLNLLLLLVVGFLPFPTRLVAESYTTSMVSEYLSPYTGPTLLAIRTLGFVVDEYARREYLYELEQPDADTRDSRRSLLDVVLDGA
jgi:uncharacterized membrane protein